MRFLLTLGLLLSPALALASPQLDRAKREDASLRKDDDRLRLRHNIVRVIELWESAVEAAPSDGEKLEALRGLADAWALLAHWSGRSDDAARAQEARARAEKNEPHTLRRVKVGSQGELRIEASGEYEIRSSTYGEHRLLFDLTPLVAVREALGDLRMNTKEIERARVLQLNARTVRIVIDFAGAIVRHEIEGDQLRLKLSTLNSRLSTREPGEPGEPGATLEKIVAEVKEAYSDVLEESRIETPLRRSTREAAKARTQSLLAIDKVVIDAGHGGKDTGARGRAKMYEKDVNLAIALKLGKELEKLGVKVVYTRKTDRFVSLKKRSSIANRSGADLFISVHSNANRSRHVHGVETYYLNTSSSRYASRLARRENGHDDPPALDPTSEESGAGELPDGALGADLRLILADLAMRSATVESRRLAGYVQSSMIRSLRQDYDDVKDLGVKHALFAVLLGVRMPSVLIETGFVTNPKESKRLASSAYQTRVAKAIARGVSRFVEERQRLALNMR